MSWIHDVFGDIENDPIAHKAFMGWFSERYREEAEKEKKEKPRKQKRRLTQRASDLPKRTDYEQTEMDSDWATKILGKQANR